MESKLEKRTKNCEYCGEEFEFVRSNRRYCSKKCKIAKYRIVNKEKIAEQCKKFRSENKGKIAEQGKKYRSENKGKIAEQGKKYREANKEKIAERNRKYRENNKEKILEISRKYRETNKEKIAEHNKKYYEKVYDECERGVVKDTLIHLIFDFLNEHPSTELNELRVEFYDVNPNTVGIRLRDWVNITYEKYLKLEDIEGKN